MRFWNWKRPQPDSRPVSSPAFSREEPREEPTQGRRRTRSRVETTRSVRAGADLPEPRPWTRWVPDRERPGGIGRAERERLFWERVASGAGKGASNRAQPARRRAAGRGQRNESIDLAILTLLSVMLFGVGWATLEIERLNGLSASEWAMLQAGAESGRQ